MIVSECGPDPGPRRARRRRRPTRSAAPAGAGACRRAVGEQPLVSLPMQSAKVRVPSAPARKCVTAFGPSKAFAAPGRARRVRVPAVGADHDRVRPRGRDHARGQRRAAPCRSGCPRRGTPRRCAAPVAGSRRKWTIRLSVNGFSPPDATYALRPSGLSARARDSPRRPRRAADVGEPAVRRAPVLAQAGGQDVNVPPSALTSMSWAR